MALQRRSPEAPQELSQFDAAKTWVKDFFEQFRLAWRLLMDGRVPLWPKILPLLLAVYLIFPFDFVPDMALGLGQLDDLVLLFIGLRLFVNLCPQPLVDEHLLEISGKQAVWTLAHTPPILDLESVVLNAEDEKILAEEAKV